MAYRSWPVLLLLLYIVPAALVCARLFAGVVP